MKKTIKVKKGDCISDCIFEDILLSYIYKDDDSMGEPCADKDYKVNVEVKQVGRRAIKVSRHRQTSLHNKKT